MVRMSQGRRASLRLSLEPDLVQVATARLVELRAIWADRLGYAPPPLRSREIFRRMLAYRLQAAALGDLSAAAKRKLAALEAERTNPRRKRASPRLRLGHGAVLIREWKGVRHEVQVAKDGFRHHGVTYKSLSEVARAITGSRWNGPLFFGLRDKAKAAS
jgi:hypothetical protein